MSYFRKAVSRLQLVLCGKLQVFSSFSKFNPCQGRFGVFPSQNDMFKAAVYLNSALKKRQLNLHQCGFCLPIADQHMKCTLPPAGKLPNYASLIAARLKLYFRKPAIAVIAPCRDGRRKTLRIERKFLRKRMRLHKAKGGESSRVVQVCRFQQVRGLERGCGGFWITQ